MSLYGNQDPAAQREQQQAPPPPPAQQQENLYGSPPTPQPHHQPPNYYGAPPAPQQQQAPVAHATTPTDVDVPGLTEMSPGVRCAASSPMSKYAIFFTVVAFLTTGLFVFGIYTIAVDGSYVGGGVMAFCTGAFFAFMVYAIRRRELKHYSAALDNNAKSVTITSNTLLTPCCKNMEIVNYNEIRSVCYEDEEPTEGDTDGVKVSFLFLRLASGGSVIFRRRIIGAFDDGWAAEDTGKVATYFVNIINGAGFSITAEEAAKN